MVEIDSLKQGFQQKLDWFKETYPDEPLEGGIIHLTSMDSEGGTVWDKLRRQIDHLVRLSQENGTGMTHEDLIDFVFEVPESGSLTAELIVARLQG